MAVIVTVILLIFVIPQFESLFKGFGADLAGLYADGHQSVTLRAGHRAG